MNRAILDYSKYFFASDTFTSNSIDATPAGAIYRRFSLNKRCPYYDVQTVEVFHADLPDTTETYHDYDRSVEIWSCLSCGWWYDKFSKIDFGFIGGERIRRRVPILRDAARPTSVLERWTEHQ